MSQLLPQPTEPDRGETGGGGQRSGEKKNLSSTAAAGAACPKKRGVAAGMLKYRHFRLLARTRASGTAPDSAGCVGALLAGGRADFVGRGGGSAATKIGQGVGGLLWLCGAADDGTNVWLVVRVRGPGCARANRRCTHRCCQVNGVRFLEFMEQIEKHPSLPISGRPFSEAQLIRETSVVANSMTIVS